MIKRIIKYIITANRKPILTIDDEYLSWLSYANAGMLNPGNIYCMNYAIKNLPSDNPVVEIGSFCGLSTNVISYLLKKEEKKNKIITSDRWIFEGAENNENLGHSEIKHAEYRIYVMETFKRNVSFFSKHNLPYPIECYSDDFFESWKNKQTIADLFGRGLKLGGNISFSYIDGNHSYEYAKRDFINTSKYLDKGGFILFDDSSDTSQFGCAKLMKEIIRNSEYELVIKNPNHLFRKIK